MIETSAVKTARLELRPVNEADRPTFVELFADADFMQFSDFGELGEVAAHERFDEMLVVAQELPFAKQAVIEQSTGRIIGYAGVAFFDHDGKPRMELGYRLIAEVRGQGYGTEAARAVLDLGRRTHRGEILAVIKPANHASRRVLDKLGFRLVERTTIGGFDAELYAIDL